MRPLPGPPDTHATTLPNGVRVVTIASPHSAGATASVFVRTGSRNESRRLNGVSHFMEHMAFKGTHTRTCQQINLDAERLGAEVNAHTDKDHTAYHMRGLARDAGRFVQMLGDIVRNSSFPEAELERERQVILHEYTEDEDDIVSTAYKLFDRTCFGAHALAQPVIGTRANISRFTRQDLLDYAQAQYTGTNVIVGVAGAVDPDAVLADAQTAFGSMPAGVPHAVDPPPYHGGVAVRRQSGFSQAHTILGFPLPSLWQDYHAGVVAAALFGEGMSSPLLDELREQRGLAYYASCAADLSDLCGLFVVEATTGPEHVDEVYAEVLRLLAAHAQRIDAVSLERARNQLLVRHLHARERPYQRLEDAAQDLFLHGRLRSDEEVMQPIESMPAQRVREVFERMLAAPAAAAVAGKLRAGTRERVEALCAARWASGAA